MGTEMKERKQKETPLLLLFYSHQDIKSAVSLTVAFISGINQVYDRPGAETEHQNNKIK